MNQCRGVIASREFRGPRQFGWPRFRILPLSNKRRLELVRKADLHPNLEKQLVGRMAVAEYGIRLMADNPMFLGLLCEHVRTGQPFPDNAHNLFETYINNRLTRDRERLSRRYHLEPQDLRVAGEHIQPWRPLSAFQPD